MEARELLQAIARLVMLSFTSLLYDEASIYVRQIRLRSRCEFS